MKMRKGFTLVELLIVVIIIGILAAAMLLSTGSATDNATATKIVGNLRSIKAAVLMFRSENAGVMPTAITDLEKYFGGATFDAQYSFVPAATPNPAYVQYAGAAEMTSAVQTQMAKLAAKNTAILDGTGAAYTTGATVRMIAE